jgi:hypothetical protein
VADNNNHLAGRLPAEPHPALRQLDRLVGAWDVSGPFLNGSISFEWMEGGFFLIQRVDARTPDQDVKGIEYIGFDEDTETLRSHYMDTRGSNFAYTWEVDGDTIRIWFGDKGSNNFFQGRFSEGGNSYSGRWQWPGGGYEATLRRI